MIEDTRRKLAEARERLSASRRALETRSAPAPARVGLGRERPPEVPATCPIDDPAAREQYVPPRVPRFARRWLLRLPEWARPAAIGAAALAGLTAFRVVAALPFVFENPWRLVGAVFAVFLASGAGAVAGLVFSLVRPGLKRLALPGDVLTGIVCVLGYVGALAVASWLAFGEPLVERGDTGGWMLLLGICLFLGCVVGVLWFYVPRDRRDPAPPLHLPWTPTDTHPAPADDATRP